jgi:adenylate cyclase
VNLAARLEPLCKQYGVVSLVSENTVAACGKAFAFRRIDRVAVVGKTRGIDVYELLGATDDDLPGLALARRYEKAFDAYLARHFLRAAEIVQSQVDRDPPSAVLAARCREFEIHPPPDDWDGVHAARTK